MTKFLFLHRLVDIVDVGLLGCNVVYLQVDTDVSEKHAVSISRAEVTSGSGYDPMAVSFEHGIMDLCGYFMIG
jgi:hypothetical protein